jgi:hypothetical protein
MEGLEVLGAPDKYIKLHGRLILDDYVPGTTKFLLNAGELVGYSAQQKVRFLDGLEKIEACREMPRSEGVAEMRSIADSVLGAIVPRTSDALLRSALYGFSNQLIQEARINAMTGCVAIERFRRTEGRFPAQWSELSPGYLAQSPEDPCTGAPLQYRLSSEGYVIYTVGLDQDDDHGTPRPHVSLWHDGDYVLIEYPGTYGP